MNASYYVHDLSPFLLRASDLNLSWITTWYGVVGLVAVFGGGYLATWLGAKKLAADGKDSGHLTTVNFLLTSCLLFLGALYFLQKSESGWGLRWYSLMYLLAFTEVYLVCRYWIGRRRIMLTPLMLDSLMAYLIIGMLLGARSAYVLIYNFSDYASQPLNAFKIWEGGLSFHGGIVGVVLAIVLYCRKHRLPIWHMADRLSLTVPFGIGVGRIGNFMNGELYGRVIQSEVPWAVVFEKTGGGPQPRHPSQIYQSIGEGWLLLLTLYLVARRPHREGRLAIAFIFFYGLYRFVVEFFREPDAQLRYFINNSVTMGQILCLLTMAIAVALFFLIRDTMVEGSEPWQRRMQEFLSRREEIEGPLTHAQKGKS